MLNSKQTLIHEQALTISKNFRKTEFELIEILQKVREEKIFLAIGFGSLFEYATESLRLSPANAYTYTKIAKTADAIPELKEEIKNGNLTITNARRIVPILTSENKKELIEKATTLSSKALEKVVAEIHPETVRESIRPVAADRMSLKLGISEETLTKLQRARVLLSNQKRKPVSLEEVLDASLEQFLEKNDPVRKADRALSGAEGKKTSGVLFPSARPSSEQSENLVARPKFVGGMVKVAKRVPIPATIRHQVFKRDQGMCCYQSLGGKKCASSHFIDIHHKKPVCIGGRNDLSNLETLCRAHHDIIHLKQQLEPLVRPV